MMKTMGLWRSIVVVAALAAVALGTVPAPASHLAESPKKHRIVYHLSEAGADTASFALRNIQNHIAGVSGRHRPWAQIR